MTAPLRKPFELLQQQSEPHFLRRTQIGCLTVLVVVAMAVAIWAVSNRIWGGLWGVVVLLFLAVAMRSSARDAAPHQARARQALTDFETVAGTVRVVATSDDGTTTYQAGVQDRSGQHWTFSCGPYGGWCPETGDYPAQLRYLPDVPWPVLVLTEQGLLHPGRQPEAKTLLLPPDDAPPTRASVRAGWIVAAVIFLLGCGVLVGGWGAYLKDIGIAQSGGVAQAVVTKVGHLRAKPGESHGLVIQFTLPDGRVVERSLSDESERWKSYRVGDTLTVHYDPGNPQRNFLPGGGNQSLGMVIFLSAIGSVLIGVGILLGWGAWRSARRLRSGL